MKPIRKTYTAGDVTVVWQPSLCIHSKNCFHGLPQVFDPGLRPWVRTEGTPVADIVAQVRQCPSGALSIEGHPQGEAPSASLSTATLVRNGPLLVEGRFSLVDSDGQASTREGVTAFCRCGASKNKPYCDGSHVAVGFTS